MSLQVEKLGNWIKQNTWSLLIVLCLVVGVVVGSIVYSDAHPQPAGTHYVYVPQYDSNI